MGSMSGIKGNRKIQCFHEENLRGLKEVGNAVTVLNMS